MVDTSRPCGGAMRAETIVRRVRAVQTAMLLVDRSPPSTNLQVQLLHACS